MGSHTVVKTRRNRAVRRGTRHIERYRVRSIGLLLVLALVADGGLAISAFADTTLPIPPIVSPKTASPASFVEGDFSRTPTPTATPFERSSELPDPPEAPPAPAPGFIEGLSQEVPSLRERDVKVFANPDGSRTAEFAPYLHYQDSSGDWKDIDLSFRPDGTSFLMNRHDLAVRVTTEGVKVIERETDKGIFYPTPVPPVVNGRRATFPGPLGLTWSYVTRTSGIKLVAPVATPLGQRTLTFPYQLVGGAEPLVEDNGVLRSGEDFLIPAPFALGADDEQYPLGTVALGSEPGTVRFAIDDSSLPQKAFPYELDPTTTFTVASSANDTSLRGNTPSYPPPCSDIFETNTRVMTSRVNDLAAANEYLIHNGFMRWSTSSLPDTAVINAATLRVYGTYRRNDDNRKITADYYTAWPIDCADYSASAQTNASGSAGWTFPSSNGTTDFALTALSNISKTGYTGLRMHVTGGTPTGENRFHAAAYDDTSLTAPQLLITYNNSAPGTPTNLAPANGSSAHTLTPTLQAKATDPDGDSVSLRFYVCLDQAMTTCVWDSGWTSQVASGATKSVTVPASTLGWNEPYYWYAYAADNWATGANPSPVWSVQTLNQPPFTPAPDSPAADAILGTLTPTFLTYPVMDPDGDAVSYWFHVGTAEDGSGTVVDSGWLTTTSWTPPRGSLVDGRTYYWQVQAADPLADPDSSYSEWSALRSFQVDLGLGDRSERSYDSLSGVNVNLTNGNLLASYTSSSATTVGGSIGLSFGYNSGRPSTQGLSGAYYNDTDHDHLFDASEEVSLIRTDSQVAFNWKTGSPYASITKDYFLARFTGYVTVPATGSYKFGSRADDGTKVWVNDTLVFDHWVNQGVPAAPQYGSALSLTASQTVPIKVEYYENTSPASLELWVNGPCGPNGAVQDCIVPASWLTTEAPGLPDGWGLSADIEGSLSYTRAHIDDTQVVLTDSSGATHVYTFTGSGWAPPVDEESVLTNDAATGLLVLHGEDGLVYSFNPDGSLASVVSSLDDRTPAAPSYTWTPPSATQPVARLTRITDPVSGRFVSLTYGADGGCPTGAGFTTPPSAMLCKIDYGAFGLGETLLYYSNGHLARIVDPGAETIDFGYDANGLLTQVRDALTNDLIAAGTITDGTSDTHKTLVTYASGKVDKITAPVPSASITERAEHSYEYGAGETKVHVAGLTEPNGYARKVSFDSKGRVTEERDLAGKVTASEYDSADRVVRTTDPTGIVSTSIFDEIGRPTDAYGPGAASEFDADNRSSTAPHATTAYDEGIYGLAAAWWNNATLALAPKLHTTLFAWPDWGAGSPSTALPSDGFSGRLTGEIEAAASGTYTFSADADADDGVKLFIDDTEVFARWGGTGSTTGNIDLTEGAHRFRIDYQDPSGPARLSLSWTPPGGSSAEMPFTSFEPGYGLMTTAIAADGKKTRSEYATPETGVPTATVIDPDGLALRSTVSYELPGAGYLRRTSRTLPKGAATTVTYAYYGDTEAATNPCTGSSAGQAGLLKSATSADPDGAGPQGPIVREFRYDAAGRVVATRVAGDTNWRCTTFDTRGRVTAQTDSENKQTAIDYSVPNRVTTSFPDSANTNRTTVATVDWLGRGLSYTDEHGTITRRVYDRVGRITDTYRTFSGGTETLLTHLDYATATGRLSKLTEYASGSPRETTFTYDDAGKLISAARPNGVTTANTYDPERGWLEEISHKRDTTELSPWSYTRNPTGDITAETTTGRTRSFIYDGAGRLTRTVEGAVTRNYSYDANSNRCSTTTSCDGSYVYDNADRITASPFATGYQYDSHGNLTQANPTAQPPAGSLNQAVNFDAFTSTTPQEFPVVAGQSGTLNANYGWTSTTPTGRSGTPTGSIATSGNASHTFEVDGESYISSSLSWTKGQHEVFQNFFSSVSAGGTNTHTVSPTGTGTISANLGWNPGSTSGSWSSSVGTTGTYERAITASASGALSASLSWSSAVPNPDLDLYLVDKTTSPETILASSTALTGNSESVSYTVPSSVTYSAQKVYTLRVKAKATGSSFTLNSTWPVTANLDLEIWRGSTLVASSSSTTAKPEIVSATSQPAGTYTLKVISRDYAAVYNTSTSLRVTYQQQDWANLTLALKDPGGATIASTSGASGSLSLSKLVTSGGTYSFAITNNSSDLSVPSYSLPWSTTTLGHDNTTGSIAASGNTTRSVTADGSGYLSSALTWTKGTHQVSQNYSSSVSGGGTKTHTFTATGTGTVQASVNWNPTSLSYTSGGHSVSDFGTTEVPVAANASGDLLVTLNWPSAIPNPDLDLYLVDKTTSPETILDSSTQLTGNSESLWYLVPGTVGYTSPKTYTLRVKAKAKGSSFSFSITKPVTPEVDLELWRGSTLVASSYSSTAKPETVSATSQPAGTYTIKVLAANYTASYTASATYPQLDWANLTLQVKKTDGTVLGTGSSAGGSLTVGATLPASGTYNLVITNNSSDLSVPSYTLDTTLPKTHASTAKLSLVDSVGATLAQSSGTSARSISASVSAGQYKLKVEPLTGSGTGTLTGSYPGREAKEIIRYDGNDHAIEIDDGTNTTKEVLAPSGRVLRRTVTDDITGEISEDVIFGYDGDGDSPAYSRPFSGGAVTTYIASPGGLVIDAGGVAAYMLANGHGDIVGSTDAGGTFTAVPQADEFGVGEPAPNRLGWLGDEQRYATGGNLRLIRMGVRLYDPALGRFLQADPIEGGSANDYDYVNGDPVNSLDLAGLCDVAATWCIIGILFGYQSLPRGFAEWLARRGGRVVYYRLRGHWRAMKSNGECSFSPEFVFHNACKTHDLGYDLIRFFRWAKGQSGPWADIKWRIDRAFRSDMRSACWTSTLYAFGYACYYFASIYYRAVRRASIP